MGIEGEPITL